MNFIENIKSLVKNNEKKTIILTEGEDQRIREAIDEVIKNDYCNIILIGESNIPGVKVINPKDYIDTFSKELYELRKDKGLSLEEARELLLNNYMYFACMLLINNIGDGIVSGACHTSMDTIRPALQLIKSDKLVSSFFIMDINNKIYLFSDAALNVNPNSEELSKIGVESSYSYKKLTGIDSKTVFLSYSSYGSGKGELVDKVKEAVTKAKELDPSLVIDGELQLDAAVNSTVCDIKTPNSIIKGDANVLIFPDLNSGNIGYKLVKEFSHAKCYGPLLQGLKKPVNDLSRGCNSEEIVGVILLTCLQAK
ncbi:MAG: phosphotransacetylase [Bacilli bacterium]|nr:phosphotransacetylase [Bacilli bacterium]